MIPSRPIAPRQELLRLPLQGGVGEAFEGLAHHDPGAVGTPGAEVQVREPTVPPAVPPFRGEHDEVERLHRLHLAPRAPATTGVVRRVQRLEHHAFVAGRERAVEERRSLVGGCSHDAGDAPLARERLHDLQSVAEGLVDEIVAVDVQHVEEERIERTGGTRAGTGRTPERAHRVLERMGTGIVVDADRLTVEHDRAHRERAYPLGDAGQPAGDLVEVARVDPHVVVDAVHLDARAIELPLHRSHAGLVQCRSDIRRTGREHREDTAPDFEPDVTQRRRTPGQGDHRDAAEIARQHRRPTHERCGYRGGAREGVGHETAQRALAQLTHEQVPEEVGLRRGRANEHALQDLPPAGRRAGAGRRHDLVEAPIHIDDAERRHRCRRDVEPDQRGPPHPDSALAGLAGEKPDRRFDLVGCEAAEEIGERRDLGGAGPRRRDRGRGGDQIRQEHVASVPDADALERCRLTGSPAERRR